MSAVRRAREDDIPAVLRLLTQVDMVHHRGRPDLFRGPATKYDENQLREMFSDEGTPVFVYDDGGVRGHAFCVVCEPRQSDVLEPVRTLYIDDICVDENCRRQGVGTALFEAARAHAKALCCHNVTLNVWAGNEGAKAFYESLGMRVQKWGMEILL